MGLSTLVRAVTAVGLTLAAGIGVRAGEVIREQDAAGQVRVVREVAEDAAGNCVNHGLWQLRAENGTLAAEGRYAMGRRTGAWRCWLAAPDIPPALQKTLTGFELPFLSEAHYAAGVMHGAWTITDARGRSCFSVELDHGVRQGDVVAWAPSGQIVRRETYDRGMLNGRVMTWDDAEQQLTHSATWINGHHLVRSVAYYDGPDAGRRAEGDYLVGPQTASTADDFWTTRIAEYCDGQACLPHGAWRHWHPSGQLAVEGRYDWGRPAGDFLWRHPNGQKAAAGSYAADGRPSGVWRWWNAEGAQLAAIAPGGVGLPAGQVRTAQQPAAVGANALR